MSDNGFRAYAKERADARFRDWLRDRAEPHWGAMVGHRITRDMAADRLPAGALRRYLIYEHGFVETAVTIFAYALAKAPGIAEQSALVETLHALTNDQLEYFERVFGALGISAAERDSTPLPAEVLAFGDGMMRLAAHGAYEEIVAGMAAAEWMYLTWSRAAHERKPRDPVCAEWIALHVGPQFTAQVDWLLEQLDRVGPALPAFHQERLADAFHRTLVLEIGFHDAAYHETPEEPPGGSATGREATP